MKPILTKNQHAPDGVGGDEPYCGAERKNSGRKSVNKKPKKAPPSPKVSDGGQHLLHWKGHAINPKEALTSNSEEAKVNQN